MNPFKDKTHKIKERINFIKTLLDGKKLEPIVDFDDNHDTEYYINPGGINWADNDEDSNDTRKVLNKKKHDFFKVINQIGGTLDYIKSGTTGHTFKGKIQTDEGEINYAVKVAGYPKRERYGNMNDIKRPENAELKMIRLLSYFVINKQTPHLALPMATFTTSIKPFVNLVEEGAVDKDEKKYIEFVKRYKKGDLYNHVSVLISEWANRGDFLDFVKKYYKHFAPIHWKVFFFQILSVLAVIQSRFPSFRHNDLKANNILVHKTKSKKSVLSYMVCKNTFMIPNTGILLKLWDFDFASIKNIVENAKVNANWTTDINVSKERNQYYDVHYCLNTLVKKGFFPEFLRTDSKYVPREAQEFFHRVVPRKYQRGRHVHKRGRLLVDDEYLTPLEILMKDPYFEEFRGDNYKRKYNKVPKEINIDHHDDSNPNDNRHSNMDREDKDRDMDKESRDREEREERRRRRAERKRREVHEDREKRKERRERRDRRERRKRDKEDAVDITKRKKYVVVSDGSK